MEQLIEKTARPLEIIETEINHYKQQTAEGIIEIGKRLTEAKQQLQHGEWGKWLEEKVQFSRQTANKFMRISEEYSNVNAPLHLGSDKLFRLLDIPAEEREEFITDNNVEDMTTRELQAEIRKRKEAEERQVQAEEKVQEITTEFNKLRIDAQRIRAKYQDTEELECFEDEEGDIEQQEIFINKQFEERSATEEREETKRPHVANNSGNNEWYTPPEYIEIARKTMGVIDLDPASSEIANQTVEASEYYTAEDNGLNKKWFGNVWMNPPYSQPLIQQFCEKLVSEIENKNVKQACVLVNNATETAWGQMLLSVFNRVYFIRGRVKFLDTNGCSMGAPLQGQCLLYYGENGQGFESAISNVTGGRGLVYRRGVF